jgi:16S rRNA (cytidine1402-2'-O)-methyltransferase
MAGKLTVVPTPLGNLEDITARALRVLREADVVLAEDTRTSGILLKHFEIQTPLKPFHKFNEHAAVRALVQQMLAGAQMALVSDAGTPGISDPGFLLVRDCVEAGVAVETLPGPTALIPALVNSGFPTDRFVFEGFLPHKKGRQSRWKALAEESRTLVFYESPHRVVKFLEEVNTYLGADRPVSVSRELSKKFEENIRGTAAEVLDHFERQQPRGEFVMVIAGKARTKDVSDDEA